MTEVEPYAKPFAVPLSAGRRTFSGRDSVNIVGLNVSGLNAPAAVQLALNWSIQRQPRRLHFCNAYSVMLARGDLRLRDVLNSADFLGADGMPLVWFGKLGGHQGIGRVDGPGFMLALCEMGADYGLRHFFYGGGPGVAEKLSTALAARIPNLQICGTYTPPFQPVGTAEDEHVLRRIDQTRPDVVWVGLGTPKQDFWLAEHRNRIQAPLLAAVGAAFDFHAGLVPRAPRLMQYCGLEWSHRLLSEPRRLWRRYLLYNPLFVAHAVRQLIQPSHFDD
jgi:N-acetylglucosaminyldiphosphoundecaprenol N-acetyl-beta-D-mannosaminyltransferase